MHHGLVASLSLRLSNGSKAHTILSSYTAKAPFHHFCIQLHDLGIALAWIVFVWLVKELLKGLTKAKIALFMSH